MSEHWPVTAKSMPTLPTSPADGHPAFLSSSAGRMGMAPHMQGQDPCPGNPKTCMLSHSCACVLSHFSPIQLSAIPWTVARQAPLSMGFSRQEDWSGSPRPPPGDLPNPGIKPGPEVACSLNTARDFHCHS